MSYFDRVKKAGTSEGAYMGHDTRRGVHPAQRHVNKLHRALRAQPPFLKKEESNALFPDLFLKKR